jgi:hypothetical protein
MINQAQKWFTLELLNGAVMPTPPPIGEYRVICVDTQELRDICEDTQEERIT